MDEDMMDMEGLISFEEIDAGDELYGEVEGAGKLVSVGSSSGTLTATKSKSSKIIKKKIRRIQQPDASELDNIEEMQAKLVAWKDYGLPSAVLCGLSFAGFFNPTDIQKQVLELLYKEPTRNIIASAPTGTGKTLAFGIPIVSNFVQSRSSDDQTLQSLILVPTRELGLQVEAHLRNLCQFVSINIVAIIGGISEEKQVRLLNGLPDIIIATPGRLWEHLNLETGNLRSRLAALKYLVFDEVDRMMERGHFKELKDILSSIYFQSEASFSFESATKFYQNPLPQTFLFSATLGSKSESDLLYSFKKQLKFHSVPVSLNIQEGVKLPETLCLLHHFCLMEEKDLFLYYFLMEHPGKTLVFCNSIDGIRRLVPILELLKVKAWGIHSKMQQRQRLKNIDRFKATKDSVLVASDVAARGIDISDIQHVVHFQLPRSLEIFIHRSGRTARSGRSGAALSLISPEETSLYRKLSKQLQSISMNSKELDYSISSICKMKQRVVLSRKINELEHQLQKSSFEKSFEAKAVNELGLDDFSPEDSENPKKSIKGLVQFIRNQKNILNSILADEISYRDAAEVNDRKASNNPLISKKTSSVVGHFSQDENVIENAISQLKKKQRVLLTK